MISNPCGRYTLCYIRWWYVNIKCVSVFALKLTCRRKKCVVFTVHQHSLLATCPQGAGEGDGQDNRSKEGRRRSCCCLVYLDTLTRTPHFKLLFFWPRIRTSYRNISGGLLCAALSFDSHHYQCCLLLPACSNICFSHSAGLCAPSSDTCRMWQRTFGYLPYIFNILLHIRLPAVPAEYSIQNEISR